MKCPHCTVHFDDNWDMVPIRWRGVSGGSYRIARCPNCKELTIELSPPRETEGEREWRQVQPIGSNRGPVPPEVPKAIATDYVEACVVLPLSAKASAALSRRCLQAVLHDQGFKGSDLAKDIDQLLKARVLPTHIHETVDAIRRFGNFGAHPINDITTLQVIDVEPEEAKWCLEILERLFDHFYVGPAAEKKRLAELDAKLTAAGKPPSK
jgi:Domain of unknown function (DUF4145)